MNIKGRSFLSISDYSPEEINGLLDLSARLKQKKSGGVYEPLLERKNIAIIFEKSSTRTRCAFEVAAYDEGARVTYIDPVSSQLNKKESVEDTARVLGGYYDALEFRGYLQSSIEELAAASGVPVFNGLTDTDHPTQILADLLTIRELTEKPLADVKVVFAGDVRNNMALAWAGAARVMGFSFIGFGPDSMAGESSGQVGFSSDPSCLDGADVVYTDVWASMGEEDQTAQRARLLSPFRVTAETMRATGNPKALFMHCLPAFHDFKTQTASRWIAEGVDIREVDDDVFRSPASVVFPQAWNRLHTIKAVMVACIAGVEL